MLGGGGGVGGNLQGNPDFSVRTLQVQPVLSTESRIEVTELTCSLLSFLRSGCRARVTDGSQYAFSPPIVPY